MASGPVEIRLVVLKEGKGWAQEGEEKRDHSMAQPPVDSHHTTEHFLGPSSLAPLSIPHHQDVWTVPYLRRSGLEGQRGRLVEESSL